MNPAACAIATLPLLDLRPVPASWVPQGATHGCVFGDWLFYQLDGNVYQVPAPETEGEGRLINSLLDWAQGERQREQAAAA